MASDGGGEGLSTLPANKLKFMCSHGGKILPKAVDGSLKYVGGETRVISIPRDMKLPELMKKATTSESDVVLKYQLIPEDLDSLVSVRTDEDLKHMFDEYDRQENEGTPKLRAFLFPSNPVVIENQTGPIDPHAIEQRYIDAINGIVRTSGSGKLTPINASRASFSISSACSSPKSSSPDSYTVETIPHEFVMVDGYQNRRLSMHKVKSSPSLCSLNSHHHQSGSPSSHHMYQHPGHHYHQNHQQHLPHSYQTYRWSPPKTLGQPDFVRGPMGHGQNPFYTRSHSSRSHLASGSYSKYGNYDEIPYGFRRVDRAESLPHNPMNIMQEGRGSGHNLEMMN